MESSELFCSVDINIMVNTLADGLKLPRPAITSYHLVVPVFIFPVSNTRNHINPAKKYHVPSARKDTNPLKFYTVCSPLSKYGLILFFILLVPEHVRKVKTALRIVDS